MEIQSAPVKSPQKKSMEELGARSFLARFLVRLNKSVVGACIDKKNPALIQSRDEGRINLRHPIHNK